MFSIFPMMQEQWLKYCDEMIQAQIVFLFIAMHNILNFII